jgi:hypothetical protein
MLLGYDVWDWIELGDFLPPSGRTIPIYNDIEVYSVGL